jgi:ribosome-associated protein
MTVRGRDLARLCCRALEDKKAEDLRVLDVSEQSSITDFLIIANGTSEPHLRALRQALETALEQAGTRLVGFETTRESGWTVLDAFDVMVHLFTPEQRAHFRLEDLWKDAVEVSPAKLLAAPARRVKKRSPKSS